MSQPVQFASDFRIDQIKLTSSKNVEVDLINLLVEINIYENIFSHAIYGSIVIKDTHNLFMNLPLLGQETLRLKISTPTLDTPESVIDWTSSPLAVYKIVDREEMSVGAKLYTLAFTSTELLESNRLRLSKTMVGSYSDMTRKVLETDIKTNKKLFIEPSLEHRKIVIPNLQPYDFISRLCAQAVSEDQNPTYLFYENKLGIHFRSLRSLYNQEAALNYYDGDPDIYTRTGIRPIGREYGRIRQYQILSNNDFLHHLKTGALGSKLVVHDILRKEISEFNYDHKENFSSEDRLGTACLYNEFDQNFVGAKLNVHPTASIDGHDAIQMSGDEMPYQSSRPEKWLQKRHAQLFSLRSGFKINLEVLGHTAINCGDVVNLHLHAAGVPSADGEKFDSFYTGRFLVANLRHLFNFAQRQHFLYLTLLRDSI